MHVFQAHLRVLPLFTHTSHVHFIHRVDVITIDKTGENFRLMFDVKGRFTVHRISNEEAKVSRSPC